MLRLLLPLPLALALGCAERRAPSPAPESKTAPAPAAEAAPAPAVKTGNPIETPLDAESALALALAPPGGEGAVDRMLAEAQAAARQRGKNPDLWVALGQVWVRQARATPDPGFYVNARAAAELALGLEPDHVAAQDLLGLALLNDHRFEAARDLALAIRSRRPDDPMALGTLSDALVELGDYEGARRAALDMVKLKPNLPSYSRVSHLSWVHGDGGAAKEAIRLAFDAGRGQRDKEPATWALVQAAELFRHEGDREGAEAGYDLALAYFADYPAALIGKARCRLAAGEPKAAVALLERALERSPTPRAAWLLGDARHAAGDAEGAEAAWSRAEALGARGDALTLSAFLSARGRDPERALRLAEKEAATRKSLDTLDALAWALHRAGRSAEARPFAEQATRLGTPDARLWFHRGAIELALGAKKEGRAHVEKALALDPAFDYAEAMEARALLGRKDG